MKKIMLAACCVALLGGMSAASAQTMSGPSGQQTMKAGDPMNANAMSMKKKKMMMKKKKMMMMKKKGMM